MAASPGGFMGEDTLLRRTQRVYDPAVVATHDRMNGVMRSQMDAWRVPRTSHRQRILRDSSHIIDTAVRQKVAREYNAHLDPSGFGRARTPTERSLDWKGGATIRHDGRTQPMRRSLSATAPAALGARPWLPPWVTAEQWDAATQPPAPAWAGSPWAAMASGPFLWAGATLPSRYPGVRTPNPS